MATTTSKYNEASSLPASAIVTCAVLVLAIGHSLSSGAFAEWHRGIEYTKVAVTILILREAWRLCPHWIKPRLVRFVKGSIFMFRQFVSGASTNTDNEAESEAATSVSSSKYSGQESQEDDITDLSNFATKVKQVLDVCKSKIEAEQDSTGEEYKLSEMRLSLLAYLQMLWQIKARRANSRDEMYLESGERIVSNELLTGADEMFDLADLAYNDHVSGEDIKVILKNMGFDLIKHDTTTPVPGYLGHYVAISNDEYGGSVEGDKKIAVIGIKGTSTFEDLLTDMCANSVEYALDHPFYKGGSNKMRCHEGVYISSQRLVADLLPLVKNLLLPSGYKIVIVGHSLGAGCATIVSVLLRASIPSLQTDADKLKVWAFASPPVLDLKNSLGCSSFVTTVVNNSDVVPRLNIGPLVVFVRLMRAMWKKLDERNLGLTDLLLKDFHLFKTSNKDLKEGDDVIMSAEEYFSTVSDAISSSDDHDVDHLYVGGKVLVLYDLWEKEEQLEDIRDKEPKDIPTIVKENFFITYYKSVVWVQHLKEADTLRPINEVDAKEIPKAEEAVFSDGTCKALRLIELDGRLVDDHFATSYRSSIANTLLLLETNHDAN